MREKVLTAIHRKDGYYHQDASINDCKLSMWRSQQVLLKRGVRTAFSLANGASRRALRRHLPSTHSLPYLAARALSSSVPQKSKTKTSDRLSPKARAKAIFDGLLSAVDSFLLNQVHLLEPLGPIWSPPTHSLDQPERTAIFQNTRKIVHELEKQIRNGHIRPNGKQRHQVSRLLERILELYSEAPSTEALQECQRLMDRMRLDWQMEWTDRHVNAAVLCAARVQAWNTAAELYESHIDPGDAGYIPCDVDVSHPMGLYAMARAAQEKGVPVVENVLDGVLRMAMVSPGDQNQCEFGGV